VWDSADARMIFRVNYRLSRSAHSRHLAEF
jgi:hypothetical protein